jgi:hypothetical protein
MGQCCFLAWSFFGANIEKADDCMDGFSGSMIPGPEETDGTSKTVGFHILDS